MDGKVSVPGRVVLSRKFVQPYPLPSLPPYSTTERGRRGSLLSPRARVPPLPLYSTTLQSTVRGAGAGERSSRPAELHRHRRQCLAGPPRIDSLEAAAAAVCQPRRSRPRPAAVRSRASSWEEKESVQDRTLTVPEQSRSLP